MGRPRADLSAYSIWGSYPISAPTPPLAAWLPVIPQAGVQTWSDLAMWALYQPGVDARVSLYTNFYTPSAASTLGDFVSPTAPGLLPQDLPPAIRGMVDTNGRTVWSWPLIPFTSSGGGLPVQAWGYYVYCTDPITHLPALLWAQRLVNSFGFIAPGNTLNIPLSTSFGQC